MFRSAHEKTPGNLGGLGEAVVQETRVSAEGGQTLRVFLDTFRVDRVTPESSPIRPRKIRP